MEAQALSGGFGDAPREAALIFRAAMNAIAKPGTIEDVSGVAPPDGLSPAAGALILTLCDADTPVHLASATNTPALRKWIAFHCGAPLAQASEAAFAVGTWESLLPLEDFPLGTPEYPDRSATLIVEVPLLEARGSRLTGPGIKDAAHLSLPDEAACRANAAQFPLGLDFFFTQGTRLAALPRSTRIG